MAIGHGGALTPYDFGAIGDGVTDDTAALQAFARAVTTESVPDPRCAGKFAISRPIDFYYPDDDKGAQSIYFSATFLVQARITGAVLRFREKADLSIPGSIEMDLGGANWQGRSGDIGILVDNCSGFSIGAASIYHAKIGGIVFQGKTAMFHAERLRTWYCGTTGKEGAGGAFQYQDTWTFRGTRGSATTQRSRLAFSRALPPEFDAAFDRILIDGQLYVVREQLSASSVSVYPALPSNATTGRANFIIGFGVRTHGGDTSAGFIGISDTLVCGTGLQNFALYPCSVGSMVTQSCGIGLAIAQYTNAAYVGGTASFGYFESNLFNIVQASSYRGGFRIVSAVLEDISKCICLLNFRRNDDTMTTQYPLSVSWGSTDLNGGYVQKNEYDNELIVDRDGTQTIAVGNSDSVNLHIGPSDATARGLRYVSTFTAYVCNSTPSGGPGTITLHTDPSERLSINGGTADLSFTGLMGPVLLRGVRDLDSNDWQVTYTLAAASTLTIDGGTF